MRYEKPTMDVMYFDETCIIVTSSIKDGTFGDVDKGYEDIPGGEF